MSDLYAKCDRLSIPDHGDARERSIWPAVSSSLGEYQTFWRTLIVLLTNRIHDELKGTPNWIRLRSTIPVRYEELAMHNYSLFYYMANARQEIDEERRRLASGEFPHPEKVFFALQASVEQAQKLVVVARGLLFSLDSYDKFPKHPEDLYATIRAYRNALAHDPVLGRSIGGGRELLPPQARLRRKQPLLWRETENIPDDEMIDLLTIEEEVWQEFALFLQELWRFLANAFRGARVQGSFVTALQLSLKTGTANLDTPASVACPFAASGTNIAVKKEH